MKIKTNRILSIIAVAFLLPCILLTTACNQNVIAALTSTLGTSAANLAKLEGQPALSDKLLTDTAAAVSAIKNWKSGTPAQNVAEALNLVEDDLNLFPVIGPYAPLVDLAIGTVESILAIVSPNAPSVSGHRTVQLANPPKTASEFRKQWNALAPAEAKIK